MSDDNPSLDKELEDKKLADKKYNDFNFNDLDSLQGANIDKELLENHYLKKEDKN